ncbi:MAG: enoyl-ACP reductase, partial [Planctomycetaceae bacterium]|nr:enoyl-ACP reductase [Planctomycetaceae bacterium]
ARPKNENKVRKLVDPHGAKFVVPCDVTKDEDLDAVFKTVADEFGKIDFVVHSVAYAPPEDLTGPVHDVSRAGFTLSMDISVYSLIAMTGRARPLLNPGGSVLCLTYFGGERVIPGYNLMGICKAALESTVTYLASELGKGGVRVNAISAGPIRTISSSGVGEFQSMMKLYESFSPLRQNVSPEDVGNTALYLVSNLGSAVTGENIHVDSGYHIMGAPPLDLQDKIQF